MEQVDNKDEVVNEEEQVVDTVAEESTDSEETSEE